MRQTVCLEPGCDQLTKRRSSRCAEHEAAQGAARRPADRRAVYASKRWRALRRQVLRDQPWCATPGCTNPSREVDHVKPLRDVLKDGGDPFSRANVQGLCHRCHSRKTAEEVWHRG